MKLLRYMSVLLAISLGQTAFATTFDFSTVPGAVNGGSVGVDGWKIAGNSYSQTVDGITVTVSSLSNTLSYYTVAGQNGLGDSGCVFFVCSAGLQQNEQLMVSFSEAVNVNTVTFGAWDDPDKGTLVSIPGGDTLVLDDNQLGQPDTWDISALGELTAFTIKANTFGSIFTLAGLEVTAAAVPVPAAAWLFGSALVGLAGIGRRRR